MPSLPCQTMLTPKFNNHNGLIKEGFTFPRILQQIQSHQLLLSFCLAMSCHGTCDLMLTEWLLHLWPSEAGGRGKAVGKKQKRTNCLCHPSLPIAGDFRGGPTLQLLIDLISQLIYFGSFLDARNLGRLVLLWLSLQKKKKNQGSISNRKRENRYTAGVWWCFDAMSLFFVLHQIAHHTCQEVSALGCTDFWINHWVVFRYLSPSSKQNYLRLMDAIRNIRRHLLDTGFSLLSPYDPSR